MGYVLVYDGSVGSPVLIDDGHHESYEFRPEVQVLYGRTLLLTRNDLLASLERGREREGEREIKRERGREGEREGERQAGREGGRGKRDREGWRERDGNRWG